MESREGIMDGCLFCRIVREEIPARIVYKDEQVIAIEDIAPVAPTTAALALSSGISMTLAAARIA